MPAPAPYDVLQHLDALEQNLTPDMPFQMLHLIRACRSLQRERDAYRDALADALALLPAEAVAR